MKTLCSPTSCLQNNFHSNEGNNPNSKMFHFDIGLIYEIRRSSDKNTPGTDVAENECIKNCKPVDSKTF